MSNDELSATQEKNNIIQQLSNKKNLVLSGGGIKGIAHIGALQALQDYNALNNIETIAGASIGALVGSLISIGYTPKDIYDLIMIFDLTLLNNSNIENFFDKFGLDDGSNLIIFVKNLFKNKGYNENVTFRELYDKVKKKLIIVVACINDKKAYYYSVDTTPDMSVIKALRMTMSVPIFFTPVEHDNRLYIDGGCIDNYPIHLFQNDLDRTIGIYLSDTYEYVEEINNIEVIMMNIFNCMMEGISCNSTKNYDKYSVKINISNVNLLDFGMDRKKKKELYDSGYTSLVEKFK